ncbi:MAG: glutathione peroxidase [Spirochaetales bacterium]|nr:glutathione peroxidase [Spirochaetales bacterium]
MSFYNLEFKTTRGETIPLSNFKGKVVLVVNTATKCGLAGQFEELEMLHQKYKDKGLAVIGFPCAQFLGQEPETDQTVESACKINFGVTFQLSQKIEVNGRRTHPVFAYLKQQLPAGLFGKRIKWNFTKFLIDAEGKPFKRYAPTVKPSQMEGEIVELLKTSRS